MAFACVSDRRLPNHHSSKDQRRERQTGVHGWRPSDGVLSNEGLTMANCATPSGDRWPFRTAQTPTPQPRVPASRLESWRTRTLKVYCPGRLQSVVGRFHASSEACHYCVIWMIHRAFGPVVSWASFPDLSFLLLLNVLYSTSTVHGQKYY